MYIHIQYGGYDVPKLNTYAHSYWFLHIYIRFPPIVPIAGV